MIRIGIGATMIIGQHTEDAVGILSIGDLIGTIVHLITTHVTIRTGRLRITTDHLYGIMIDHAILIEQERLVQQELLMIEFVITALLEVTPEQTPYALPLVRETIRTSMTDYPPEIEIVHPILHCRLNYVHEQKTHL